MSTPTPRITTQYPTAEPSVFVAPDFQQVGADTLIGNSATVAGLQSTISTMQGQIADLTSRVTALEAAARAAAGEPNP